MNPLHYYLDLYRNDNAILLHYGRRRRKSGTGSWLLYVFLGGLCLVLGIASIGMGLGAAVLFGGLLLLAKTSEIQERVVMLDRDAVLVETAHAFGWKSSKRFERTGELDVFFTRRRIDKRRGRFYDCVEIAVPGLKEGIAIRTTSPDEACWLAEKLRAFLDDTGETRDVKKDGSTATSNGENTENAVPKLRFSREKSFYGRIFYRVPTPAEQADAEGEPPEEGVLRIRCGFCRHIVPERYVFADHARCACPHCQTLFEVPSLKRTPLSRWRRFQFRYEGENLEVRERLFGWAPHLWLSCLFISAYLGFIILGMFALIVNAKSSLTPEQFHDLWTGAALGPHPAEVSYRTLFRGTVAMTVGTILLVGWIFTARRGLRITPTECVLTRYVFFYPRRTKIPRPDLRRFFIPSGSLFGGIVYRGENLQPDSVLLSPARKSPSFEDTEISGTASGNCRAVSENYSDASSLQGIVNHYLLTHPPAERRPFFPGDETVAFSTLGGDDRDCVEFRLHDTDTGRVLPFDAAAALLEAGRPAKACLVLYPKTSLSDEDLAEKLEFEKTEGYLRFGVSAVTEWGKRLEKHLEAHMVLLLLGFYSAFFLVAGIMSAFENGEWKFLYGFFGFAAILVLFSLVLQWKTARTLDAGWALLLTKDRLELKRKFRDWEDCRTISRTNVLFVETVSTPQNDGTPRTFPGVLRNGPACIRLKNGDTLGIPGLRESRGNETMQALVNELNEFLDRNHD